MFGVNTMSVQVWTDDEWRTAQEMRAQGHNSIEIGLRIGRRPGAVRSKFSYIENDELRLRKLAKEKEKRAIKREASVRMPKLPKFEAAMVRAIKSGEEKAVIGIVKDSRPLHPTSFQRGIVGSVYGSPALSCCE